MFKKIVSNRSFQVITSAILGMVASIFLMITLYRPFYLGQIEVFFLQQSVDQIYTYVAINSTPEKTRACKWRKLSDSYAASINRHIAKIEEDFDLSRDNSLASSVENAKTRLAQYQEFISNSGATECP